MKTIRYAHRIPGGATASRPLLRQRLRHGAVALALAGWALAAQAQETQGNLRGEAVPGATVTVVHLASGQSRTVTADAQGRFFAGWLPPGDYRVSSGTLSQEVAVAVGVTRDVQLRRDALDTVVVEGRRQGVVDVQSVENATVFTAEQLDRLPVARDVQSVAQLAPGVGVTKVFSSDLARTNLPTISGASAAENAYYINGMDVTDLASMVSYATVPFEGVEQQQVKTGGYGAEFGRSLGGVLSVVTKRGTNTWTGGASATWVPDALRARGTDIVDLNPDNASGITKKPNYVSFVSANRRDEANLTLYAGGPLLKDRLFVFGLLKARHDTSHSFSAQSSSISRTGGRPDGLLKLDFTPNEHHAFEFTAIRGRQQQRNIGYSNTQLADAAPGTPVTQLADDRWFATRHIGEPTSNTRFVSQTKVLIGKYTGYVNERFTWSALVGRLDSLPSQQLIAVATAQDCPVIILVGNLLGGCQPTGTPIRQRDPAALALDQDRRTAYRLDGEYLAGAHTLRWGVDAVRFSSYRGGLSITGGTQWRYYKGGTGSLPGLVPPSQQYVQESYSVTESGGYAVRNAAAYVEDAWQVSPRWLVIGGLRSESFDNRSANGVSFIKASGLLAPRLGVVWNVRGDASMRVYASAGRYFIPIPSVVNTQLTRGSAAYVAYYTFTGRDPRTGAPTGLSAPIGEAGSRDIEHADPATLVDPKLKPMSQDEWALGFQQALDAHWTIGAKATVRRVNNGVDDYCSAYGQKRWAVDQGYTQYRAAASPGCFLINPGQDVHAKLDLNNDGQLTQVTIPASYIGVPAYRRNYRAIELTLERRFSSRGSLGASYVWSQLRGTSEGYVGSGRVATDPTLSYQFDFASTMQGSGGPLPLDRRHVIKAYGHLQATPQWRMGANLLLRSGTPTSCYGFVPSTVPDYAKVDNHSGASGYSVAASFYCLGDDKKTHLTQQGSQGRLPWTHNADLSVAYLPPLAQGRLTLQAAVFNVFNTQQTVSINETRDLSRANTNLQDSPNPATQAGVRFNPNYRQPTGLQAPRSVQLTARYEL